MLLHVLLWMPFVAAILMTAASQRDGRAAGRLALMLGIIPFLVATFLLFAGAHPTKPLNWFVLPGSDAVVHYALSGAGISLWLAWLASAVTLVALLAARSALGDRYREFSLGLFALEGAMMGTFLAQDAVLFFFFFEAMIVPAAILIASFGGAKRKSAAMTFAIYTLVGSAPMALALWYLIAVTGATSVAEISLRVAQLPVWVQNMLFWAFVIAFAVKTPVFPLHGWQAKSYAEAPSSLTAILSGVMAKAGVFGFIAWTIPLFAVSSVHFSSHLVWLGLLSMLYGALLALRQTDSKKLLAFSSMSHLGLAVAGVFSGHPGVLAGVLLLMIAHGLSASSQFFLCGIAERWTGSRSLSSMGAFASTNPVYAFLFGAAGIAAVAVPGTAGFVGEFLIIQALWSSVGPFVALIAGIGMILSATYTLRFIQAFLFGPVSVHRKGAVMTFTDALAVFPLVILLIAFGVHPAPVLNAVKAPVVVSQSSLPESPSANAEVVDHAP